MPEFKKPHALTDVPFHYCPGCTHGIVHRLVAEVIDEMGIEGELSVFVLSDARLWLMIILNAICLKPRTDVLLP